mgnify:CR=1 FL=1
MSQLIFEMKGSDGTYDFWWEKERIQAKVLRTWPMATGDFKSRIKIDCFNPIHEGHVLTDNLNISSSRAKKDFANDLFSIISDIPVETWRSVVEQLCVNTQNDYEAGSPLETIRGVKDVLADEKWLVEPILQIGHPTIIWGKGASGKSWLAQYVSVLADEGISATGLRTEPCNVLYLDWETDPNELESRVSMIRKGLGLDGEANIKYRHMSAGLSRDIDTIRRHVQENDINLLVIDSLGAACAGEPESADVVLRAFGALRSLKVTALCIDHSNKSDELFGSVYKFNSARQVFEVKADQFAQSDYIDFGLFHTKSSNGSKLNPFGFQIEFLGDHVRIHERDIRDSPLEENMPLKNRLWHYLSKSEPVQLAQIAEDLDVQSLSNLKKELNYGMNKGWWENDKVNHKWFMPELREVDTEMSRNEEAWEHGDATL